MALILDDTLLPRTATPHCPHFGDCGGCAYQDVPYHAQLAAKRHAIEELLQRPVEIVPSPDSWGYRHRMDFAVAFGKIGLRKRGDGKQVVDLNECHIVPPRVSALLPQLHGWLEEFGIQGWNLITKRGDLRYLTFRHAPSSGQLMTILVTFRRESGIEPFAERLAGHADSVVWAVQERVGDDSHGELQRIWGRPTLEQRIGDFTFEISPGCFFQNNLLLVEKMYEKTASFVHDFTFDLFCGTGTIGIYASRHATKITGVDNQAANIELARRNLARNSVTNAEFFCDNANHFLSLYDGPVPDTIILDPPRSGLAPKLIRKLLRLGAPRIIYVSCNPASFAADLTLLSDGYSLREVTAFDMFPQTPHVELVTVLEKD